MSPGTRASIVGAPTTRAPALRIATAPALDASPAPRVGSGAPDALVRAVLLAGHGGNAAVSAMLARRARAIARAEISDDPGPAVAQLEKGGVKDEEAGPRGDEQGRAPAARPAAAAAAAEATSTGAGAAAGAETAQAETARRETLQHAAPLATGGAAAAGGATAGTAAAEPAAAGQAGAAMGAEADAPAAESGAAGASGAGPAAEQGAAAAGAGDGASESAASAAGAAGAGSAQAEHATAQEAREHEARPADTSAAVEGGAGSAAGGAQHETAEQAGASGVSAAQEAREHEASFAGASAAVERATGSVAGGAEHQAAEQAGASGAGGASGAHEAAEAAGVGGAGADYEATERSAAQASEAPSPAGAAAGTTAGATGQKQFQERDSPPQGGEPGSPAAQSVQRAPRGVALGSWRTRGPPRPALTRKTRICAAASGRAAMARAPHAASRKATCGGSGAHDECSCHHGRGPPAALSSARAHRAVAREEHDAPGGCSCGGKGGDSCNCARHEVDAALARAPDEANEKGSRTAGTCACGGRGGAGCTCGGHRAGVARTRAARLSRVRVGRIARSVATAGGCGCTAAGGSCSCEGERRRNASDHAAALTRMTARRNGHVLDETDEPARGPPAPALELDEELSAGRTRVAQALAEEPPSSQRVLSRLPSLSDIGAAASSVASGAASAVSGAASAVGGAVKDAVAAVLPDWVTDGAREAQRTAESAESEGNAKVEEGQSQLQETEAPLKGDVQAEAQKGDEEAQAENEAAQSDGQSAAEATGDMAGEGRVAAGEVAGMGGAAAPLMSPAQVIAQPGAVDAAAAQMSAAGQAAAGEGGQAAVGEGIAADAKTGLGPGARPGWTCDESELVAIAGGVARSVIDRGVGAIERATGMRPGRIRETVRALTDRIGRVVDKVRAGIGRIGSAIKERFTKIKDRVMAPVNRAIDRVKGAYERISGAVGRGIESAKKTFSSAWERVKGGVSRAVTGALDKVRSTASGVVNRIGSFISGAGSAIWAAVPESIKGPIRKVGGMVSAAADRLRKGVERINAFAVRLKDRALNFAKGLADKALRGYARLRKAAGDLLQKAKQGLAKAGRAVLDRVKSVIPQPIKDAAKWARDQVGKLRDAARGVIDRAAGAVCSAIDPAAETCADQHLPDLGQGTTNSMKLTATKDVTIPLHEVGVPANLKVAQGSSVEVSRAGGVKPAKFVVKVVGDSSLALTEAKEGPKASPVTVTAELPGGNKSRLNDVWKALQGGGGPAPAGGATPGRPGGGGQTLAAPGGGGDTPAAPGAAGAVPAAAGGGGGWSGSAELGIKGKVTTSYEFTAGGSNCDGVGGLVAFLTSYGISGSLPAPFNSAVGAVSDVTFRNNMTSCTFTATEFLTGTFELTADGIGKLKAALGGQVEATIGMQKGPDGVWRQVQTLTLSATGSSSAALEMGTPLLSNFGASVGAGVTLSLKLSYIPDLDSIQPTEAKAEANASLSINGTDPSKFAELPGAPEAIRQAIAPFKSMQGPAIGSIEAKVAYAVTNLEAVQRRLTQYFDSTPPESVNTDGVIAALRQAWKDIQAVPSAEIKLKATQRFGVSAKAGVDVGGGAVVGVGAGASVEHTIERVIYSYKGGSGGAVPPPVVAPPVVPPVPDPIRTPDDPPPPPTPPDDGGGGRKRPTLAEVLAMPPSQFEQDKLAHDVLWEGATDLRNRMDAFGRKMIDSAKAKGESEAKRKRDSKDEFTELVIEKCKRKGYKRVGEMDDIARGRFNMSSWADVTAVIDALRQQTDYKLHPEHGIQDPRREQPGGGFGYPRFHVILIDSTSMTFEWQVGTLATTRVFETEGIELPTGMDEPGRRDLHDVEYDVLKPIQEGCRPIADKHGIPPFRQQVDTLAAESGEKGDKLLGPDGQLTGKAKEDLDRLHKRCGEILSSIAAEHGVEFINTVMRERKCVLHGIDPVDKEKEERE